LSPEAINHSSGFYVPWIDGHNFVKASQYLLAFIRKLSKLKPSLFTMSIECNCLLKVFTGLVIPALFKRHLAEGYEFVHLFWYHLAPFFALHHASASAPPPASARP